ncbi:MAG: hypothetical protein WA949_12955 [Phormidesmis sp.]
MKPFLRIFATSLLLTGCSAISELSNTQTASTDASSTETSEVSEPTAESTDAENTKTSEDEAGVNQKSVKIVVEDQSTAGQIVVEEVATARDGWISIHKSNEDGGIVLPDSIGEARVDSGDSEDIIVDLWDAPYLGDKLWALLHIDSGDRGTYEFPGPDVAVKKDGETMARSFRIKAEKKDDE